VCHKTSVTLHDPSWPELFGISCSTSLNLCAAKPELRNFLGLAHRLQAEPKMLIRYERQAFLSNIGGNVRISFDRCICHQSKNSYSFDALAPHWAYNDGVDSHGEIGPRIVLELKVTNRAPVWLVDLVRNLGLVRRGYSKYCTAVTRILNRPHLVRDLSLAVPAPQLSRR
jgi:hypothetical protein